MVERPRITLQSICSSCSWLFVAAASLAHLFTRVIFSQSQPLSHCVTVTFFSQDRVEPCRNIFIANLLCIFLRGFRSLVHSFLPHLSFFVITLSLSTITNIKVCILSIVRSSSHQFHPHRLSFALPRHFQLHQFWICALAHLWVIKQT